MMRTYNKAVETEPQNDILELHRLTIDALSVMRVRPDRDELRKIFGNRNLVPDFQVSFVFQRAQQLVISHGWELPHLASLRELLALSPRFRHYPSPETSGIDFLRDWAYGNAGLRTSESRLSRGSSRIGHHTDPRGGAFVPPQNSTICRIYHWEVDRNARSKRPYETIRRSQNTP